jgi:hypothetical protein
LQKIWQQPEEESIYHWLVYLHVLGVFGFLISHAASVHMAFAIRRGNDIQRLHLLLQLSISSYRTMYPALLVIVLTGIIMGFQAHWWNFGWIWTSLTLPILIVVAMGFLDGATYGKVKGLLGMGWQQEGPIPPEALTVNPQRSTQP